MSEKNTNDDLAARRVKSFSNSYASAFKCYVDRAEGALVWDVEGKEYIDFAGGIGGMNVGHSHPKVVAAIQDQARKCIHTCFHVAMYEPYIELAARLNDLAPGDFSKMTLFANSGAEAVENAIKVARYAKKRPAVICFENAYHGRTLYTLSLTSKIKPYRTEPGKFSQDSKSGFLKVRM